jgi:hypothetical protein
MQVTGLPAGSTHGDCDLRDDSLGVPSYNGSMNDEQGALGLDTAALIAIATGAGYSISARMMEAFRADDLLSRPVRAGNRGRTPIWVYPDGADRQLLCLLGWRKHVKDPATLRVLLWLDGFPIDPTLVRDSLIHGLESILSVFEKAVADQAERQGLDPDQYDDRTEALRHLAGVFAAKRGPGALPRRARVRAADRSHAVELVLRLFAFGDEIATVPGEAETVERVLGLAPNGRSDRVGDAGPWLTGPASDLFAAAEHLALPRTLDTVRASTAAELETARGLVVVIFRYLPLMARMIGVAFDDENYAGFAGFRELDQRPEFVMLLVPMVISMLRAGLQNGLETVVNALKPFPEITATAERILDMPAKDIDANLAGKPADVQQAAQRLVQAALDGQFNQVNPLPPHDAHPAGEHH